MAVTVTFTAVQTLRGNQGTAAAANLVAAAVAAANATNGTALVAHTFTALAPNTKGMQFCLTLYAALAAANGATLVRLGIHNGAVTLVGPQAAITATLAAYTPAYNAIHTAAAAAYTPNPAVTRMAFTNAYVCGAAAALAPAPATLALGLGFLHTFTAPAPAPYALGYAANPAKVATPAPAKVAPAKVAKVAAA